MQQKELPKSKSFPLFVDQGFPIQGDNGIVHVLPELAVFFSKFPSSEIHWCYRTARTKEVPIPPLIDLPPDFIPGFAIFTWTFLGGDRVFVNADDRGIFIGDSHTQYCICVEKPYLLNRVKVIMVTLEEMAPACIETFMQFFPTGLPPNLQ